MNVQLSNVAGTYLDISNDGNVSQRKNCFCSQITASGESKTHERIKAIEAWQYEAQGAVSYQVQPLHALPGEGRLTVFAQLTGNFPASPVQPGYVFLLEGDQVCSLEIMPC
ncbi:nuclear transport factor 2 family protein [Pseudomonas sp. LTJR-52]|uniref:nuclear transport factor 2 family protein n=1 Tax=Pseudomonas sp. LTJR-52 TaxID=2479392 RepID=UPI000EFB2FAC|nr:nuclear transport factor 2 family protein [Pseudomonas sp. LTJR-52]AYN96710.1 nuclear transport factor 2 family protein [Pseudomonas sp. LTJR-52]